jgi:hypothetical protein
MCDRLPFLKEKAENFRAFVLGQNPDADLSAQIETFQPDLLLITLTTVLLPAIGTQGIDGVVDEVMTHLAPQDISAVRAKIERYITCFFEVLTQ